MSRRSGIMLCYPYEEKRLNKWEPPYFVQPKLDGIRCRAIKQEKGWVLLSSEMNEIYSVPHILDTLDHQFKETPPGLELDGELYVHGMPFESIDSIVSRSVNFHPDFETMEYHVFDLVETELPQWERIQRLHAIAQRFDGPIRRVRTTIASDHEGVFGEFLRLCGNGYEGIVVRHVDNAYIRRRSTLLMKFKPKKQDTYTIIGFKQMKDKDGNLKDTLGSFIFTDGYGNEGSVGSGMTDEFRTWAWAQLKADPQYFNGKKVTVQYQNITEKGVPRFGTFSFKLNVHLRR